MTLNNEMPKCIAGTKDDEIINKLLFLILQLTSVSLSPNVGSMTWPMSQVTKYC